MIIILTILMKSEMIPFRTVTFTRDNVHMLDDYIYDCAYYEPLVYDVQMTAIDETAVANRSADSVKAFSDWEARLLAAESCQRCNLDTHRCPGCGCHVEHGTEVCAECNIVDTGRDVHHFPEG